MKNKALHVARWEFLERVKTKAFIMGLIMMPLILGLFMGLPSLLMNKSDESTKKIGVIDETNVLFSKLSARINEKYKLQNGKPNYEFVLINTETKEIDHWKILATAKVLSDEIDAYFILPRDVMEKGKIEFRSKNVGNVRDQERFSRTLEDIIVQHRLESAGFDAKKIKELSTDVDMKTIKISSKGDEKESGFMETFFSGYIFIMMMMFLVMTTGQMMIRSVVEEKSNRIVEILMSSCSSRELMMGKVLGLSLLGITTVAFWILLLIGVNFATPVPIISMDHLALLLLYFLLGYLLYSAIFVAAGAPISTEQEAQQVTSYVSITLVLPIALAVPVMQNPNSLMVKILTQIPLLTPTFMALRFSIQMPEVWEILLSLFFFFFP